jgi:hypothetical protein
MIDRPWGLRDRDILERAVRAAAEQAKTATAVVDETHNAGLDAGRIPSRSKRRCSGSSC